MPIEPVPARSTVAPWRDGRLPVVLLGLFYLPAGIQAAFFPQSFYDDFPMGRGWIAVDGPYNEHFVRDIGALFLALAIASFFAWWQPALVRPLAVAWLVFGVLHLVYHAEHLEHFDGVDKVGLLGSLIVVPALAIYALVAGSARRDVRGGL